MTADRSHALAGLVEHADSDVTGCARINDRSRTHSAHAYFTDGKIYAVHVNGFRPAIADRMLTAGLLDQVLHDQVIAAAGGDTRSADIGNLAVRRGMVAQETLDAIHREILLSAVAAIATWGSTKTRFRKGQTTKTYTVPAVPVSAVLAAVDRRAQHWDTIWNALTPGCAPNQAVPRKVDQFPVAIDHSPDTRALLAHVNGVRTVDDLAGLCGLTRFETGHLLHGLVVAGLVSLAPITDPIFSTSIPEYATPEPSRQGTSPRGTPGAQVAPAAHTTPTIALTSNHTNTAPPPAATTPTPAATPPLPPLPDDATLAQARTAYAAAEDAFNAANRRAAETYTDHTRLAAVSSDAQHAANQAEQSRTAAANEEQTAHEHLALAQAAVDKAAHITAACTRALRELTERATTVASETERARLRAHQAAAAAQAAADHLDDVRAALARARTASHPADH